MERIKENDLFCEKCFLHFDTKYVYDIHLSFVHQKGGNIMQLKLVDIKNEYEDLIHHSNISKPNKNPEKQIGQFQFKQNESNVHQCSICNHSFSGKSYLKRHIELVHEKKEAIQVLHL